MIFEGNIKYNVDTNLIAKNDRYHLRKCFDDENNEYILQIATDMSKNTDVANNAYILAILKSLINDIDNKGNYGYKYSIPTIIESTIVESEGFRQLNILKFENVENISDLIPLVKLLKKSLRVDLRTSAWIFGKLLKIIDFAHSNNIENNNINCNNILIEPNKHYVILFDWSKATIHENSRISNKTVSNHIKLAAQTIINALGGDLDKVHESNEDIKLIKYIQYLADHGETTAKEAHKKFYKIVDALCNNPKSTWKPGFHNFTTVRI